MQNVKGAVFFRTEFCNFVEHDIPRIIPNSPGSELFPYALQGGNSLSLLPLEVSMTVSAMKYSLIHNFKSNLFIRPSST